MQVVWHKFARYWDIEIREVPMSPGSYAMDPASMLERVDENTIMVVPTFGVTYTGAYEPVEALAKAFDQLQADTPVWTSTSTWMGPAALSWPRSAGPRCFSTSASHG